MTRADDPRLQCPRGLQRRNPLQHRSIPGVVERSVDAGIAREQHPLLRQPRESIPLRVRHPEVDQLRPLLPVVEDHPIPEQQRRRHQPGTGDIRSSASLPLPSPGRRPEQPRLEPLHRLQHPFVGHDGRALIRPHRIAVGVVPVMMRVEGEPDGLRRPLADLREHLVRAGGKVGIHHQHVIPEHDPSRVAVRPSDEISLMEPNPGRDLLRLAHGRLQDRHPARYPQPEHPRPRLLPHTWKPSRLDVPATNQTSTEHPFPALARLGCKPPLPCPLQARHRQPGPQRLSHRTPPGP